jgi:hypothetical protein
MGFANPFPCIKVSFLQSFSSRIVELSGDQMGSMCTYRCIFTAYICIVHSMWFLLHPTRLVVPMIHSYHSTLALSISNTVSDIREKA